MTQVFCDETSWTNFLWKKTGGCIMFLILRVKITSCACLDGLGLKFFFHFAKLHSTCIGINYCRKQRNMACKAFWLWLKIFSSIVYINQNSRKKKIKLEILFRKGSIKDISFVLKMGVYSSKLSQDLGNAE